MRSHLDFLGPVPPEPRTNSLVESIPGVNVWFNKQLRLKKQSTLESHKIRVNDNTIGFNQMAREIIVKYPMRSDANKLIYHNHSKKQNISRVWIDCSIHTTAGTGYALNPIIFQKGCDVPGDVQWPSTSFTNKKQSFLSVALLDNVWRAKPKSEPQTDGDTKQILLMKKMHRRELNLHGP